MKNNSKIKFIKAREILDSRGNPTVEVELTTDLGNFRASVPSGISRGKYEAVELRDGDKRYQGKGVKRAVSNVNNKIAPKLKGKDPTQQREVDDLMIKLDGTKNKSKLGANAILPVSIAVCRAGAIVKNLPLWRYIAQIAGTKKPILPIPSVLLIEGGVHAGNELDFQEFMVAPKIKPYKEALRVVSEIYQELRKLIKEKYTNLAINVGDEGGFALPVRVPEEAIELILKAAKSLGYQEKITIFLDIAASQFYARGVYKLKIGDFTKEGLFNYYSDLIQKYPIAGLEDPFSEEDWVGFQMITKKFGKKINIIGDDILATNIDRVKMAVAEKSCNGLVLKSNQIGTVSEAIEVAKYAMKNNWQVFVKHRSGETYDDFIADLAVGLGTGWIMAGAPARGERIAKYNRLLRIEEELK